MRTAGIDLATQEARTAVCTIDWCTTSALVHLVDDRSDAGLVAVCRESDKVGIDCPLGWPVPFVDAIRAHRDREPWPGQGAADPDAFRALLALRETDRQVHDRTKCSPLRVAADRIGLTTMRCALLLDALGDVDRTGLTGTVAEVYPAASLRIWGLRWNGYKGAKGRHHLAGMVEGLLAEVSELEFAPGVQEVCEYSDDAFDALVCAITAKRVVDGRTHHPEPGRQEDLAATEGWIHLPMA